MKSRLFTRFNAVVLSLAMCFAMSNVCAQNNQLDKKQEKEIVKEAKKTAKEYEKDGWKVSGATTSLEKCLAEHNIKKELYKDTKEEVFGEVSKCRSMTVCQRRATFAAQTKYAEQISGELTGKAGDMLTANDVTGEETAAFVSSFTKIMAANLSGALEHSFEMEKDNGDGTKSYRIYFFVDKTKVAEASKSALKKTLEDVELSSKIGDEIFKFVE